jgi:signal transduction histidine kinase
MAVGELSRKVRRKGHPMFSDFLIQSREHIVEAARRRVASRQYPVASPAELRSGVPIFLDQLCEILRLEAAEAPSSDAAIGATATRQGAELLARGFTLSEVVHDYGDICQAVMEVASAQNVVVSTEEFGILNRSLDTAIAEAVTEHARLSAASRQGEEVERLGHAAHEIRDRLNTAVFAFDALRKGHVGINGSTAEVLGRSLAALRDFVDTMLADVRVDAKVQRRVSVPIAAFLNDVAVVAGLQADYRRVQFELVHVDNSLVVAADPQLLGSALMNLLNNAFKYTPAGGTVVLRAYARRNGVVMQVQDACGGIPDVTGDPFRPFGERRGVDRSGLGLGLSIARKAIRAQGGEILIQNMPGHGCIFSIELPAADNGVALSTRDDNG